MQSKSSSVSFVRLLYIPRTRPVVYGISGAGLACSIAEELICTWFLGKDKKENGMYSRRYLQSVWNTIDALTSLCDTFMTAFLKSKEISQAKEETTWQKSTSHSSHLPAVSEAIWNTDSVAHLNNVDRLSGASQEFM